MVGEGAAEFPFAAAGFGAVIKAIPVFPARSGIFFRTAAGWPGGTMSWPDYLWVGADERELAPAFLLQAVAGVEQRVVAPAVGDNEGGAVDGRGHATGRAKAASRQLSSSGFGSAESIKLDRHARRFGRLKALSLSNGLRRARDDQGKLHHYPKPRQNGPVSRFNPRNSHFNSPRSHRNGRNPAVTA
jgi:hypothetical protein